MVRRVVSLDSNDNNLYNITIKILTIFVDNIKNMLIIVRDDRFISFPFVKAKAILQSLSSARGARDGRTHTAYEGIIGELS